MRFELADNGQAAATSCAMMRSISGFGGSAGPKPPYDMPTSPLPHAPPVSKSSSEVACPLCGDTETVRLPSAPRLQVSRHAAASEPGRGGGTGA